MRRLCSLFSAVCLLAAADALASPKHTGKHSGSSPHATHPAEVKLKPSSTADDSGSASAPSASAAPTRGPTRIDFDDRLIQGQSNTSGAVYLYDRKELKTRSMVKKRESFRDEIITSVFDT